MLDNGPEYDTAVRQQAAIYEAQTHQLERAYTLIDPVSWRKHPLSPLTSLFLSHLAINNANYVTNDGLGNESFPRILDLGCGAGEKTEMFRYFSLNVVGVDNIIQPLMEAQQLASREVLGTSMDLFQADIQNLPFRDESFDGAHDYLSFLHIIRADWHEYVESVARVMKVGAPLLIVTFTGNDPDFYGYPINKMEDRGIVFSDEYYQRDPKNVAHLIDSYFYFPTERELRGAFEDHFDVLDIKEFPHPLHTASQDHKDRKLWHLLLRKF